MALFKRKSKKENKVSSCSCCEDNLKEKDRDELKTTDESRLLGVKILGGGCKKCDLLEQETKIALGELGLNLPLEHVTDFGEIASYGVMTTPALVVAGKVVLQGKNLKAKEIIKIVQKNLN